MYEYGLDLKVVIYVLFVSKIWRVKWKPYLECLYLTDHKLSPGGVKSFSQTKMKQHVLQSYQWMSNLNKSSNRWCSFARLVS